VPEKLEFTGERFTPECQREIWYEHMHRYVLAAHWCDGRKVLDAACGEGYGSHLLARTASSVTGVDISEQAVRHANQKYGVDAKLEFKVADCTQLPFEDGGFDVVVSFETLEHLSAQQEMIAEFRRVLDPGGMLVLSSPDKAEYSDRNGFNNEFHVRELYRDELETLLAGQFPSVRVLGQKLLFHSAIWDLQQVSSVTVRTLHGPDRLEQGLIGHAPLYFIALCAASDENLPGLEGLLDLFDDDDESVYKHYQHEIRKNMEAGGILQQRDEEIASLRKALAARRLPFWKRWLKGR
jgi:SAM-dependent methyltransferase